MTALLLMYLCVDASHTDCQVIPVQRWIKPDAYEQCIATVPQLTAALTAKNRKLHYFICEVQGQHEQGPAQLAAPRFSNQSLRM